MKSSAFETEYNSGQKQIGSKSKLERYVDILKVLACDGPIKLRVIIQQTHFNSAITLENLCFLVKLNLVEEETDKDESIYSITSQGERVMRFLGKTSLLPSTI